MNISAVAAAPSQFPLETPWYLTDSSLVPPIWSTLTGRAGAHVKVPDGGGPLMAATWVNKSAASQTSRYAMHAPSEWPYAATRE
eukprot:7380174-Prymnesium_polylepis.3